MNGKLPYAIAAAVQERAATILTSRTGSLLPIIKSAGIQSLKQQLLSGKKTPENLQLNFSPLLNFPELMDLLKDRNPADLVKAFLNRPLDIIKQLVEAEDPAQVKNALEKFFTPDHLKGLLDTVGLFVERQFSIVLTLVTTVKNLMDVQVPHKIQEAYIQYFFGENGYQTIDGVVLVPPAHLTVANITDLFSERTADRYVRDLVHLTVEAAGDVQYQLRTRYPKALAALEQRSQKDTLGRWFKGFASMAEAWVTSAVEEACLGVSEFQSNALIAASAGTYAGTVARKAAQHVFLGELGINVVEGI